LWILAEKYTLLHFQNTIIDSIVAISNKSKCVRTSSFHYIYHNTTRGSILRKFVVAQCMDLNIKEMDGMEDEFPREMLFEMAVFVQKTMRPNLYRGDLKARESYLPILTKKY
jgi:hypothetical protein